MKKLLILSSLAVLGGIVAGIITGYFSIGFVTVVLLCNLFEAFILAGILFSSNLSKFQQDYIDVNSKLVARYRSHPVLSYTGPTVIAILLHIYGAPYTGIAYVILVTIGICMNYLISQQHRG